MRSIGLFLLDLMLVLAATLAALAVRNDFAIPIDRLVAVLPYLASTGIAACLVIWGLGLHRSIWGLTGFRDFERVAYAGVAIVLTALVLGFVLNRLDGVPRTLPLLQGTLTLALMLGARGLTRRFRRKRQGNIAREAAEATFGRRRSTVLIVGVNAITELYLRGIGEIADGEVEVAGILGRNPRQIGRLVQSHRVLGLPSDVRQVLRDLEIEGIVVDQIAVAVPLRKLPADAQAALREIENSGRVELHLLADQLGIGGVEPAPHPRAAASGELAYTERELALVAGRPYWRWKRAADMIGALVLLIAAAPLIVIVALAVLIDVGAPILFCQRRPGLRGRPFRLYKFRTMAAAYDRDGVRIEDARRSSWIGHLLRRTRLDELPQLYNVLIGDMSFVGPRPLLPIDQAPEYRARLLVRPGLTGWAQVKGGRVIGPADKAALDVWYVQNASLSLDLSIALRTIPMVVVGESVDERAIARAWQDLAPTGLTGGWGVAGVDDALAAANEDGPVERQAKVA